MHTLAPQLKDLGGGFVVRRLLPSARRRSVGPFVFFDHFGPTVATATDNHDVRPHPHIGLATVTYLFEGAMLHRDSTGAVQRIEPGAINWMTAGRGVVHSERSPDDLRRRTRTIHGLQMWTALPDELEETEPRFEHTPAAAIPQVERGAVIVRVLVGRAFGVESPVRAASPTVYLDMTWRRGAEIELSPLAAEQAVYSIDAPLRINGETVEPHNMMLAEAGVGLRLAASQPGRAVLIGGDPLGERYIWWNFVSSRKQRIVEAADDWAGRRFPAVPGEAEFMEMPERRP
jgi:redox-sensitive bicupin YhaK (pirin superfamily)